MDELERLDSQQIDDMLAGLQQMLERRQQLIAEYNRRPLTPAKSKFQRPTKLPKRSPERMFWTLNGKTAIRFSSPNSKPCYICSAPSNVEIDDRYGKYVACSKHGKILANRLGIQIEGMSEEEQRNELDDLTVEQLDSLLAKLHEQIRRVK